MTVLDMNHPITQGMPKKWMHPFEQLTHGQHGPAKNMHILTYAWSKDVNENEPMDWVIPYGKGRVYTTMLGHSVARRAGYDDALCGVSDVADSRNGMGRDGARDLSGAERFSDGNGNSKRAIHSE